MARKTAAKASAPAPVVRHRPRIERRADEAGGRVYRLTCPCAAPGAEHHVRSLAEWELREHLAALPAVPAAERCADPKRHDRQPWERCELCASQVPLFDLI